MVDEESRGNDDGVEASGVSIGAIVDDDWNRVAINGTKARAGCIIHDGNHDGNDGMMMFGAIDIGVMIWNDDDRITEIELISMQ